MCNNRLIVSDRPQKIWLDDMRNPFDFGLSPEKWTWVQSVYMAKSALLYGEVEIISLDHDLGQDETGYDLVCWMEETGHWPTKRVIVHTANPSGKERMLLALEHSCPVEVRCVNLIGIDWQIFKEIMNGESALIEENEQVLLDNLAAVEVDINSLGAKEGDKGWQHGRERMNRRG